ncbi:MAG: SEC-C domain-containing protein [Planctomycetota bacterium]
MDDEDLAKVIERQRRQGFGFRWDGLGDWTTDAIFAKLREWGVATSLEQFPAQAKAAAQPDTLYEQWHGRMQQHADDHNLDLRFWGDFALIAAEELWERLTPELACPDTVANYFTDALEKGRKRKRHPIAKHSDPQANAVLHLVDYLAQVPADERAQRFEAVGQATALYLSPCITNAVHQLAKDKPEEAVRVGEILAPLEEFTSIQNEVTTALAHAGHRELALRRAQAGLDAFPGGFPEYCIAAEVHHTLGDDDKALELLKAARSLVNDPVDAAIVDSQAALIVSERKRRENAALGAATNGSAPPSPPAAQPPQSPSPYKHDPAARQPGPNERCPCGSGRKYKKCCGRMG